MAALRRRNKRTQLTEEMKFRIRHIALAATAALAAVACNVTRKLPEGEYLLQKVKIEEDTSAPRHERITADELDNYVRQSPNKRIFGINFYAWVYNLADPDKDNWWNNFKRKIGQAPVVLDMEQTRKSVRNIRTYLDTRGYFSSDVTCRIDTLPRRRVAVTYSVRQGEPMRIDSIGYEFRDEALRPIILSDTAATLLHRGDVLDIARLDNERERIARDLNDRGYYNFSVNNIFYSVDTLSANNTAAVKMVVQPTLTGYNERGVAQWENNAVFRISEINVYPTYDPMSRARYKQTGSDVIDTAYFYGLNIIKDPDRSPRLRNAVLRRTIPIYPNYLYDAAQVTKTYNELMSLGFFRSAKITFSELRDTTDTYVSYIDNSRGDGGEAVDTREGFLRCDIYATPALKQSVKVELEASTTSSFYGLSATLGYSNRNIFQGAESFDASVRVAYEYMKAPDARKRSAQEVGVTTGLSFPRFLLPFHVAPNENILQPRTRLELSFDYQNRPYYRRNLSSMRWAYSWSKGQASSFALRPIDINWIDVHNVDQKFLDEIQNEYLRNTYVPQLSAGLSFSYVYNNQRTNIGRNATMIRFNAETVGNLIDGLERIFSHHAPGHDYYQVLGIRYAQYVRGDINLSHNIVLGKNMSLAGRIFAGVGVAYGNSKDMTIPFDRMFYCGGANSMRGWTPRNLGPGNAPEQSGASFPTQVGDMRLEANLEFRFPIWGIFQGATFLDLGNVWYLRENEKTPYDQVFHFDNFYKQLGFNTGVGLRIDVKFVVLRFDLGLQLHNPNRPAGQRWIRDIRWSGMALNFGVGYPF
ncbi:MAG: BamA/TamA family outer membrane protein [Alistipes sp.]|nr:BamA/TamA family outer membrane protein [Alistipes sp.]